MWICVVKWKAHGWKAGCGCVLYQHYFTECSSRKFSPWLVGSSISISRFFNSATNNFLTSLSTFWYPHVWILSRLSETLVVDVLSVKTHPRSLLLKLLPDTADILCTHPMFGPVSGAESWEHLPFMYDAVRTTPSRQDVCDAFIDIYRREKCRMVPMTCNAHDDEAACSQFLTHVTGTKSTFRVKFTLCQETFVF